MKRASAGIRSFAAISLALGCLILSGCTGTVSGQVYFDQNRNGTIDSTESGVPYAKLSVYRSGKVVAERYADANGNFAIQVRVRSGQLCLQPDLSYAQENINYLQSAGGKGIHLKAVETGASCTKSADCDTDEECISETCTTKTTACTSASDCDSDETCSFGKCVTKTTTTTTDAAEGWVDGKLCKNFKGRSLEVQIPVKMDFEGSLEEMPTRLEVTCYSGASCEIKLPFPAGCQLDTMYLPEMLTPDAAGSSDVTVNSSLNSVSFESGQPAAQKAETAASPSISVSTFRLVTLKLQVADDAAAADVTLNPTADCGGETLELSKIPITIKRDLVAALYQELKTSGTLHQNATIQVEIRVDNKGKSPLVEGELTYTSPEDAGIVATSLPAGCDTYSSGKNKKVLCKIDRIPAGEVHTVNLSVKLPDLADADPGDVVELGFDSQFTADGLSQAIQADDVSFDVTKT